jgi:hypothetical protein
MRRPVPEQDIGRWVFNDECRSPNDERMTNAEPRISSFELLSSLVIRHLATAVADAVLADRQTPFFFLLVLDESQRVIESGL